MCTSTLKSWQRFALLASLFAILTNNFNAFGEGKKSEPVKRDKATQIKTDSPIKHIIVLTGENRTFDHVFGTYVPKKGETISNLLSKGIVNADGTPGPNFSLAQQFEAIKPFQTEYFISLTPEQKKPYSKLAAPTLNFALLTPHFPPGTPASLLAAVEPSLEPQDLKLLTTGAASQFSQDFILPDPDTGISNFNNLPNGPFPLEGTQLPYDSCEPGRYYMVNNDNPGFLPDGKVDTAGIANGGSVPPTNVRTVGEALNEKGISWAYYGGAYHAALELEHNPNTTNPAFLVGAAYCNICNFESYATAMMGNPAQRTAHIKDTIDFFNAIESNTLPAVSFVKPDGLLDGHPASSKLDLLEGMTRKIFDHLKAHPDLMATTAFIVTMDEGGGYYDSGYIQPLDFFGDGPRIPLIIVSNFTKGGHINHTYTDHVSILKFIERNWGLKPLTARSRDNFPNPVSAGNPYVPTNSPALGDLFDMFSFGEH